MKRLNWRWRCDACGDWIEQPSHGMLLWSNESASDASPLRAAIVHHANSGTACTRKAPFSKLPMSEHLDLAYGGQTPDPGVAVGFALWVARDLQGDAATGIVLRLLVRGFDEALPVLDRYAKWAEVPPWRKETARITPEFCASAVAWASSADAE